MNERQREIAVRTALGAGRGRLIRQPASESLPLAAVSGLAGVLVALASLRLIDVQAHFDGAVSDFIDECHFNPSGHRRMAELVHDP